MQYYDCKSFEWWFMMIVACFIVVVVNINSSLRKLPSTLSLVEL